MARVQVWVLFQYNEPVLFHTKVPWSKESDEKNPSFILNKNHNMEESEFVFASWTSWSSRIDVIAWGHKGSKNKR